MAGRPSPWAGIASPKDYYDLADTLISDKPQEEGIQPTWSPLDYIGPAEMMAAKGVVEGAIPKNLTSQFVKQAATNGPEIAAPAVLRNPWASVKDLAWGKDITQMSPREYGLLLSQISKQSPKNAGGMLNGAYIRGRLKTDDMSAINEAVAKLYGFDAPKFAEKSLEGAKGFYNPNKNLLGVEPITENFPDPKAMQLGVLRHELEHAKDAHLSPDFIPKQEFLGRGSKQIRNEQMGQLMEQLNNGLPANNWHNPWRLNRTAEKLKVDHPGQYDYLSSLGDASRELKRTQDYLFNESRFGDPLFFLEMQSQGHMKDWPSFEGGYAQKMLSQDALRSGKEIHPEIMSKYKLYPEKK